MVIRSKKCNSCSTQLKNPCLKRILSGLCIFVVDVPQCIRKAISTTFHRLNHLFHAWWKTQWRMPPAGKVDLTPGNNLILPPEEFGRRGQYYFGLSAFEGFEFTDTFACKCYAMCRVDNTVKYGVCHCGVTDSVVPVQLG